MPRGVPDLPSGGRLAVFAKAPVAGFAKTRLIPRLGAAGAAELHALLVRRTLETAKRAGFSEVSLWCAPDKSHPFFVASQREYAVRTFDQPDGDLGSRMRVAFETLLSTCEPSLLIGTDCPALSPEHLQAAWSRLLTSCDAVFVPALDGGYALIGLGRVDPRLFQDIPWGTSTVMAETRGRLADLGWSVEELPPLWDVDEPEDVDRLMGCDLLSPANQPKRSLFSSRLIPAARSSGGTSRETTTRPRRSKP